MFEKTIKIGEKPFLMRASALFKTQYMVYFDKIIELELKRISELMSKLVNYELKEETDLKELKQSEQKEFLSISQDIANSAGEIAWIMIKCGDKNFTMDFESFENTITDYDWIMEVIALAGATFCGWEIPLQNIKL